MEIQGSEALEMHDSENQVQETSVIPVKKCDMHVHVGSLETILDGTKRKGRPLEVWTDRFVNWVRQKAGFDPIFAYKLMYRLHHDPKVIHDLAMARGMDYFTITDHDEIKTAVEFLAQYPELEPNVIVGEEVSTQLKDRDYEMHVGVYDVNEEQHRMMQQAKHDLEGELIPYLNEQGLLFALNHPFMVPWAKKGARMTKKDILLLQSMFDVVEKRNGNIAKRHNKKAEKYFLGSGTIAGSDTHNGGVGRTYTEAQADTKQEFIQAIKRGEGVACGKHESIFQFMKELCDKPFSYGHKIFWDEGLTPEQMEEYQARVANLGQQLYQDENGRVISEISVGKQWRVPEYLIAAFAIATSPLWAVYHQTMDNGVEEW